MREIKFRAWEPDTKKMVEVFGINPMVRKVYLSYQQLFGMPGDDLLLSYEPDDEYSYVRLMKYTGLKDKNGVEIYVGDICNTHLDSEFPYIREVVQVEDRPVIEFKPATGSMLVEGNMKDTEVIGNIYENPELLEADS